VIHSEQTIVYINQADADWRMAIHGLEIVLSTVGHLDHAFGGSNTHVQPIVLGFHAQPAFAKRRINRCCKRFGFSFVGSISSGQGLERLFT